MSEKLCFGCMEHIEEDGSCSCGFNLEDYQAAPHQLIPGTMLENRYMIGKVLGEGGFGITYVGRDTVLDMKVAVKEFYMTGYVNRNNSFSSEVQVSVGEHAEQFHKNKDKFLKEARVLAKFANEDGIVGIRDFFEDNNTAYIVMDFLTGETLKSYLKRVGKLSWQKTMELMEPVINSLAVVHEHSVIHRDISPDNIMLTDKGNINLLDFGAAREIADTDIKSLSVILKPGFAPEEQYRSKGQQGPWTDIYALCATIYSCITGVVPDDSMERMFEDCLKSPHEQEPSCGIAISNVIMKGMAVRQKDRYQTVDELKADLDRAKRNPEDARIAEPKAVEPIVGSSAGNNGEKSAARSVADANATVYAEEIVDKASGRAAVPVPQAAQGPQKRPAQGQAVGQRGPVQGQAMGQRGPVQGQAVGQRGPVQGQPVSQRGPVQGQAVGQRGPVQGQPVPQRRPVQGQPVPQRGPVQGQPVPQRGSVQGQAVPQRGPVQGQAVGQRGPVQGQPVPQRGPVQGQPMPQRGPVQGQAVGQRGPVQSQPVVQGQSVVQGQPGRPIVQHPAYDPQRRLRQGQPVAQGQPVGQKGPAQGQPVGQKSPVQGQSVSQRGPVQGQPVVQGQAVVQGQPGQPIVQHPAYDSQRRISQGQPSYSQQSFQSQPVYGQSAYSQQTYTSQPTYGAQYKPSQPAYGTKEPQANGGKPKTAFQQAMDAAKVRRPNEV